MSEKNVKSILALLILLVAFSVFLIFYNNQDTLMTPSVFPMFMTLSAVGLGLLVGLLYLVNKPQHTHVVVKAKKAVSHSKSSRKKRK